jgi:hypothetical protein
MLAPAPPRRGPGHGSTTGYARGCHCDRCRAAAAAYEQRTELLKASGQWMPFSDPQPAIRHLQRLLSQGMTLTGIADLAGLGAPTLHYLLDWQSTPPELRRRIRTRTVQAVVAIQFQPTRRRVPALGSCRRLQALAVGYAARYPHEQDGGWPFDVLAGRLGVHPDTVCRLRASRQYTSAAMAGAIQALCRELHGRPGPSPSCRARALTRGWVPLAAWDDIDDPEATPQGVRGPGSRAEHTAALLDSSADLITHHGFTLELAAERLGTSRNTLERAWLRYQRRMRPLLETFGQILAAEPGLSPAEAARKAGSTLEILEEARELLRARPAQQTVVAA